MYSIRPEKNIVLACEHCPNKNIVVAHILLLYQSPLLALSYEGGQQLLVL
jgi:hypothetical protein